MADRLSDILPDKGALCSLKVSMLSTSPLPAASLTGSPRINGSWYDRLPTSTAPSCILHCGAHRARARETSADRASWLPQGL